MGHDFCPYCTGMGCHFCNCRHCDGLTCELCTTHGHVAFISIAAATQHLLQHQEKGHKVLQSAFEALEHDSDPVECEFDEES